MSNVLVVVFDGRVGSRAPLFEAVVANEPRLMTEVVGFGMLILKFEVDVQDDGVSTT